MGFKCFNECGFTKLSKNIHGKQDIFLQNEIKHEYFEFLVK